MAGHAHSGHSHAGHAHGRDAARAGDRGRLAVVLILSAAYMFAEAIGGYLTGSLALLADAGHTLSDVGSLVLGLFAVSVAARPATAQRTYGHTRVEILAALAQGVALVAIALMIFVEAVGRIGTSSDINGLGMMLVASGGLLVNSIGLVVLNTGRSESINIRGVWLHLLSDALGSVGVIAAGCAVWLLGWAWTDAAVSMLISVLVLYAAWQLVRDAIDILMEGAPSHIDVEEIRGALTALPEVEGVHDLHVWTIGNGEVSLSSHLVAPAAPDPPSLLGDVRTLLGTRFEIHHTTVQIELGDAEASCEGACDEPDSARPRGA